MSFAAQTPVRFRREAGAGLFAAVAVAIMYVVSLANAVIGVVSTIGLEGPTVAGLERRYGDLRRQIDGAARVAYVSDHTESFVGARYALAPTILDSRFVELDQVSGAIVGFNLEAIADAAVAESGLAVVCEFRDPKQRVTFEDELSAAAASRGLTVAVVYRSGGLSLLAVGG